MGKILIADGSEEFRNQLSAALAPVYEIFCCGDSARTLELLQEAAPDLLVLDLMVVGDGMEVLRIAKEKAVCPRTVITGRFFSDYVLNALSDYPVEYVFRRPCSVEAVVNRVNDLLGYQARSGPEQLPDHAAVTVMLHELGIPTNYSGFDQMRQGILMLAKEPGLPMTKVVYPAIADACAQGGNATTVERNIRSAIAAGYARRNDRVWRRYFQTAANGQIPKPTNTQFLTRLSEEISCGALRKVK